MGHRRQRKIYSYLQWFLIILLLLLALPLYLVFTSGDREKTPITFGEQPEITVLLHEEDRVVHVPLEEYCVGVLAGEMPASFELEALKAQALAIRTFTVKHSIDMDKHDGKAAVCTDYRCCQAWQSESQMSSKWGPDYGENLAKLRQAVAETQGEIIVYHGEPIGAVYHSTCGERTENAEDYWQNEVPYLKSVACGYDGEAPKLHTEEYYSYAQLAELLEVREDVIATMAPVSYSDSGRVKEVSVGDKIFSGVEVREKLQLASTDFSLQKDKDGISFQVQGYGHGVGLCQYGANGMAKAGFDCETIIKQYYTGVTIEKSY